MEVKATIEPFNIADLEERYSFFTVGAWRLYTDIMDHNKDLVVEHVLSGIRFQVKVVVNMDDD